MRSQVMTHRIAIMAICVLLLSAAPVIADGRLPAASDYAPVDSTTNILVVYGVVWRVGGVNNAMTPWPDSDTLQVRNANTEVMLRTVIGAIEPSRYGVVFIDTESNAAASKGDVLFFRVIGLGSTMEWIPHILTSREIDMREARVDVANRAVPADVPNGIQGSGSDLRVYPNPTLGGSIDILYLASGLISDDPQMTGTTLSIFDCRGKRVRAGIEGHWQAGFLQAHWDGRDAEGREVPAGAYFVRYVSERGGVISRKVVVVR